MPSCPFIVPLGVGTWRFCGKHMSVSLCEWVVDTACILQYIFIKIIVRDPHSYHPLPSVSSYLLAQGADMKGCDRGQWNALHHAAAGGHAPILSFLLTTPFLCVYESTPFFLDLDAASGDGSTPLLLAIVEGHLEAARYVCRK